jgi:hypothetical protein
MHIKRMPLGERPVRTAEKFITGSTDAESYAHTATICTLEAN